MVAAVIELVPETGAGEFQAPAITVPPADAPYATIHASQLNRSAEARNVRIAQLEHFIRQIGLEPPAYCKGWEIR